MLSDDPLYTHLRYIKEAVTLLFFPVMYTVLEKCLSFLFVFIEAMSYTIRYSCDLFLPLHNE